MNTRKLWISLFLAGAAACSSESGGPGAAGTSKFLGKWTYLSGSTIVIDCPNAPTRSIDLSNVPPANQPGYFTFSAAPGEVVHEVDARGCTYDWAVTGDAANAAPNQSCATFPDGRGGNQVVHLQSGTKSTPDGVSMNIDVHFTNDPGCAIEVHGTASKS
jgi:hypothetical protein